MCRTTSPGSCTALQRREVNTLARTIIKDVDRDMMAFAPEKDRAELPTEAQVNHGSHLLSSKS